MARTDHSRSVGAKERGRRAEKTPTITPVFPLLLLETMRDMDRPEEVLEDEDVTASLPRRFGLSDVVFVQIRRFQNEVKQKRAQSSAQVEDLVRLVVRRPDAERIFNEAGRRIAQYAWDQRTPTMRRMIPWLPRPLAVQAAYRAARRLFRQITGDSRFHVSRWPVELKVHDSLTARADADGTACAFYSGAFGELLQFYTGRQYRVKHSECEARGDDVCHWTVEVAS
jgi:bacteriochlorophyll 4-vinyl reductase